VGWHHFEPPPAAQRDLDLSLTAPRPRTHVVALFLLLGPWLASCREPAPTDTRAFVANPKHDFGQAVQGEALRHVFVTHNRTNAPLAVENARGVLGCSGVASPSTLAANQSGKFEVTCRANVAGPLRVSLPLRANGRPAGELALTAEIEPLLAFDRALLELGVPFGQGGESEARLRGRLARSARLTLAGAPPPGMDVSILPATRDGAQGAKLALKEPPVGVHAGSLRFHTALEAPVTLELPYSVKVTGTLTVSPTNPVLDLAAPAGTRAIVAVTSTQPGFRVERAEVLEGPFSTRVRNEAGGAAIEVSLVAAKFPEGARGANGRIRIVSNDRTEPNRELSLFALGRPAPSR
jgi:hypothetical protein